MELTPQDLREIADKLDEASKVSFQVDSIRAGRHKVMLKCTTTPPVKEGQAAYKVVGITAGEWSGGMR
jgi:hypothetical protein